MKKTLHDMALIYGSALITAFFSEFLFFNAGPAYTALGYLNDPLSMLQHMFELGLWYSAVMAPLLLIITYFKVRNVWSLFITGCLFGFFTEGLVVPVFYFELPLSLLWVSASWHPLICFMLGWVYMRHILQRGDTKLTVAVCVALGVFWAMWSTYLIGTVNDQETGGNYVSEGDILGPIDIEDYFFNAIVTTFIWFCGNILVDRFGTRDYQPGKAQIFTILAISAALFILIVVSVGILSLVFVAVTATFIALLHANRKRETQGNILNTFSNIPMLQHGLVFITPIVATLTYAIVTEHNIYPEAFIISTPIAFAGFVMLIVSPYKILKRGKSNPV